MTHTTLHLLSGKIASGKSTLAKALATQHAAIVISEDYWLSRLYPGQITSVSDYVRLAGQIREVVGPLVTDVLSAGVSVVMDFPANTLASRQWLRSLAVASGVSHCVHYLEVDEETCRARLHLRNADGHHDFAATDAEFDLITRYFLAPSEDEGLTIKVHRF